MTPDTLAQLLRQADREAGGPRTISDDLPERVHGLARQRSRMKYHSGAAVIGLIAITGVLIGPRLRGNQAHPSTPTLAVSEAALDRELLAIRAETERLRAEFLKAQPPMPTRAQPITPVPSVDEELERAAYLIVYQADRYRRELDMPDSAAATYRQTIDLFPGTRAAQTAQARLGQLESTKGHQL